MISGDLRIAYPCLLLPNVTVASVSKGGYHSVSGAHMMKVLFCALLVVALLTVCEAGKKKKSAKLKPWQVGVNQIKIKVTQKLRKN